jgi:hypothetical protein
MAAKPLILHKNELSSLAWQLPRFLQERTGCVSQIPGIAE